MSDLETSVILVGAGPVGLVLAHLLGRQGVPTLLLEMADELPDEPRAVGLDAESLRTLQALDLVGELKNDILFGLTGDYLNGDGKLLFELPDAEPGAFGYPNINGFHQPTFVRTLAKNLDRYPSVTLLYGHVLVEFEQRDTGVRAQVEAGGQKIEIRSDYLVGCDGGRSKVRSLLGIAMQGESNPQPWLVIDTREREPITQGRYRFFCDPRRPGMFIQTPPANRRWEWMVLPGENREDFLKDETIHELISPFVNVDDVDIYRRRVYDFHAILADRFQDGRAFLAGDAAHMTPPFAGQGLNSGLRDAANLGWKLAQVVASGAPVELLDSYEPERRAHAKELIDVAVELGNQIQPTDPEQAALRDLAFAEMHEQPGAVEGFVADIIRTMADRSFTVGAAVGLSGGGLSGRMLPQPMLRNLETGERARFDNVLGEQFSILGFNRDPALSVDDETRAFWESLGCRFVAVYGEGSDASVGWADESALLAESFASTDASMVLLRPDRFCMAEFGVANAEATLAQAAALLRSRS
jgi:3-(3-hydroxy-phenyl)propionate hydroxylase